MEGDGVAGESPSSPASLPLEPWPSPLPHSDSSLRASRKELEIYLFHRRGERRLIKNISRLNAIWYPGWVVQQKNDISKKISELWIKSVA